MMPPVSHAAPLELGFAATAVAIDMSLLMELGFSAATSAIDTPLLAELLPRGAARDAATAGGSRSSAGRCSEVARPPRDRELHPQANDFLFYYAAPRGEPRESASFV
jgi:hypothetical protein